MKKRILYSIFTVLLVAGTGLTYLIQTGERGLTSQAFAARTLDVIRLTPDQTSTLNWKPEALDAVFAYAATLSTDSMMIVTSGQLVAGFGDLSRPYNVHSIRKALLSAVVGQHVGAAPAQIHLEATLKQLGIDDTPQPLTDIQKTATVEHLLASRSGINHPAAAEAGLTSDKDSRLGNGDNQPGTLWAYNNWDYNALTTIFEQVTGLSVAEAFQTGIAQPSGMKDFSFDAVSYVSEPQRSEHRAASFSMSARDLATFGQIYLNKGRVGTRQILPASWIERIADGYSLTGRDDLRWAHGDLWWIPSPDSGLPEGTFWAWGLGNQALVVIPAWDTVIVVQSDTTEFLKRFIPMIASGETPAEAALERLILSCTKRSNKSSAYCTEHRFTTRREFEKLISLVEAART
ncbi:serine hydrolase domain-containing protein [Hoeflea sp.]|uniref:serine hydrolase domain-containing protein n=1 Tax=Hoeflea sp. TaxID=1940281 RepID=UPI00374938E7